MGFPVKCLKNLVWQKEFPGFLYFLLLSPQCFLKPATKIKNFVVKGQPIDIWALTV